MHDYSVQYKLYCQYANPSRLWRVVTPGVNGGLAALIAMMDASNRAKESEIIETIQKGDFDAVTSLLQSKVSANWACHEGFSLLIHASSYGKEKIVKLLVKNKADPAYTAPDQCSALICAAGENHVDICRFLLSCPGVTPDGPENSLQPLYMAVSQDKLDAARLLLDAKADPELTFIDNFALGYAAHSGYTKMLKLLLQYGADPNKASRKTGSTPLFFAISKNNIVATIMLLHAKADVDHRNAQRQRPIHVAMRLETVKILQLLFKRTSYINKSYKLKKNDYTTPLLFAIDTQSWYLLETVLQRKADVNKPNSKGMTPLLMAAKFNDVKIVRDA